MPVYGQYINEQNQAIPIGESVDKISVNQILASLIPLGYQQINFPASAVGLLPMASANYAYIEVLEQDVRYRDDGTAPTTSAGMVITAGKGLWYTGDLSAIQFIETTSGAEINITYYKRPDAGIRLPLTDSLIVWLKADELVYKDAGVTLAASGETVEQWVNSINGKVFSQSTGANKPTYQTNQINGMPILRFDGVDDVLVLAEGISTSQVGTMILVMTHIETGSRHQTFTSSNNSSTDKFVSFVTFNPSSDTMDFFQRETSSDQDQVQGSTPLVAGNTYIQLWASDGLVLEMRLNGEAETETVIEGANTGDWFADSSGLTVTSIGALREGDSNSLFFKGDLAEILLYDRILFPGEQKSVEAYLKERYGV